jgi:hypothetical protein
MLEFLLSVHFLPASRAAHPAMQARKKDGALMMPVVSSPAMWTELMARLAFLFWAQRKRTRALRITQEDAVECRIG